MIRPLIESMYDYRMVFAQETNITARNNYKQHYLEACAFVAAEETLNALGKPNASLQQVIGEWNNKNAQANKERKDKLDFKSKLDQMFKNAGKNYYRNRDYERSRDRSDERKQSRFSIDNQYSHSRREYTPNHNHNHNQKYEFHYKSQSNSGIKYRVDRY